MPPIDWSSILGLVAIALCWSLAIVLFRAGSKGKGSRKLGVLLVIEGFALITNVIYIYLLNIPTATDLTVEGRFSRRLI